MNANGLDALSVVAIYSAIAVYVVAFMAFALDLSSRSTPALEAQAAVAAHSPAAHAEARDGVTLVHRPATASTISPQRVSRPLRVGMALTVIGWIVQLGALVLRGVAAGRVPWANLYEFEMTGTAIMIGVFLFMQLWRDARFLGAYVTGLVALLLGLASVNFYVPITPLPLALQSVWLVIHVFVATLGTGFFAVGGGLAIAQLLQARRESKSNSRLRLLGSIPSSDVLETVANRVIIIGFIFWTFTLIAGAIWAERAWGRYWGWDTKEVWTFIIWVLFAGYIHARATRGWRGTRSSWLAVVGFMAVLFNFSIVNLFFKGWHSYSGL
jgi:cytochrome c-type biogenesis protein CcsB